ncbi:MAG: ribosome biogenesis GTP-binding protein YihA/YsxC [Oscillospiraceae bacterium]|nr:ribosome biogenesis GTP-binding protein YihA/YsxC [Oscillospiraceae bacterium]
MNINFLKAEIITTVTKERDYPKTDVPEIAFVGRSNVGKSSLINCLLSRKNLARTSGTPGKTATVNFYNIDDKLNFVDLPGYGYAKVSKVEKEKWGKMIEEYLAKRENLLRIFQLVDIRHKPSVDDCAMMDWVRHCGYVPVVIATKLDKIKKAQVEGQLALIRDTLKLDGDSILIPFSAEKRTGKEELQSFIDEIYTEAMETH